MKQIFIILALALAGTLAHAEEESDDGSEAVFVPVAYFQMREVCVGASTNCYRGFWSPREVPGRTCYRKYVGGRTMFFCLK
jgi:hypothetical protein